MPLPTSDGGGAPPPPGANHSHHDGAGAGSDQSLEGAREPPPPAPTPSGVLAVPVAGEGPSTRAGFKQELEAVEAVPYCGVSMKTLKRAPTKGTTASATNDDAQSVGVSERTTQTASSCKPQAISHVNLSDGEAAGLRRWEGVVRDALQPWHVRRV